MKLILIIFLLCHVSAFRICHINDFYSFGENSLLCDFQQKLRESNCDITTFGGDVLSYRDFTKGLITSEILNSLNITFGIPGNHEFEFGREKFFELVKNTNFPWILSNVPSLNLTTRININNFTFIGLWHKNLKNVMFENFEIMDYIESTSNFTIALTHMDLDDDIDTIEKNNFKLILGGHDHEIQTPILINNTVLIKSLSDYREIHVIDILDNKMSFTIVKVERGTCKNKEYITNSSYVIPYNIDTTDKSVFNPSLKKILFTFLESFPLSDLILQNKGLFRENRIFLKGEKTKSFIINSVATEVECKYYDTFLSLYYGIFVNNAQFVFKTNIFVNFLTHEIILPVRSYRIVINNYLEKGKDGFHTLLNCKNTNFGSYEMYDLL